jgi:hypothetical protein
VALAAAGADSAGELAAGALVEADSAVGVADSAVAALRAAGSGR